MVKGDSPRIGDPTTNPTKATSRSFQERLELELLAFASRPLSDGIRIHQRISPQQIPKNQFLQNL